MGYIIDKLQIQNFKYITNENPICIDIEKNSMVVLSGQNGYGKTTFFDAIELLLTGRIEHLTQVNNRQSYENSIEELSNQHNKDIVISAWLSKINEDDVIIRRVFQGQKNYDCIIWWNDDVITQDELNQRLEISEKLFSMGTYMSQSKSLNFLENKLKDRKTLISTLVDTKDIDDKINLLKDASTELKNRIENKKSELNGKINEFDKKIETINNEIEASKKLYNESVSYVRLFKEEYLFDKEDIEVNISFANYIEPLNQLRDFVNNYDNYSKKLTNDRLNYAISISKYVYMSVFFKDILKDINENIDCISKVEKCYSLLENIENEKWEIDIELCKNIGILDNDIIDLQSKIDNYNIFISNLNSMEQSVLSLQKSRKELINKYHQENLNIPLFENQCPLCGIVHEDIESKFNEVEKNLMKSIEKTSLNQVQLKDQIMSDLNSKFVPLINKYIENTFLMYTNYKQLKDCVGLDTKELEHILSEYKIEFYTIVDNAVNLDIFEMNYKKIIEKMNNMKKEVTVVITDEKMEIYKKIHLKYYQKGMLIHSTDDIDNKISYIAQQFNSGAIRQLTGFKESREEIKKNINNFEISSGKVLNSFNELIRKYTDANKEYQSKLANALRIPVLIYSGKIIQNFPLGLGIDTKVARNQLIFEAFEKKGTDVFNILSTGQLNGLAISIMLAIRNVYGGENGLDVLLIDDPLQTIDEISAISLADLLSVSNIKQVIMSTHEDKKAKMMKYKFKQRSRKTKEIDMKKIYLSSRN